MWEIINQPGEGKSVLQHCPLWGRGGLKARDEQEGKKVRSGERAQRNSMEGKAEHRKPPPVCSELSTWRASEMSHRDLAWGQAAGGGQQAEGWLPGHGGLAGHPEDIMNPIQLYITYLLLTSSHLCPQKATTSFNIQPR